MKTTVLVTVLFALSLNVQAQYYQRAYGKNCDVLNDGTPTTHGMNGHLMVGHTDGFGGNDLAFIRTDANGVINVAPTFKSGYRFLNSSSSRLNVVPVDVMQTATGAIVVVGNSTVSLSSSPLTEVFIALSTSSGVITSAISYASTSFLNARATRACLSTFNTSHVYVTGYVNTSVANDVRPFIICYNWSTNTTVWTKTYDFNPTLADQNIPAALICSPYGSEVAIIGNTTLSSGVQKGFYFRVNRSTGAIIQSAPGSGPLADVVILSGQSDIDELKAITTGYSSVAGSVQGYVIAGNKREIATPETYPWIFKIDLNGNITWSRELVHGNGYSLVNDIVQRLNTSGQYEFYLTGNAEHGYVSTDQDIVVFKCDQNGFGLQEFTYENPGLQQGVCAGIVRNTSTDGLGIYGTDVSGNLSLIPGDLYMIKAYFNGSNACLESIYTPTNLIRVPLVWTAPASVIGTMTSSPMSVLFLGQLVEYPYCSTPFIPGASNARLAEPNQPQEAESHLSISPNPSNSETQTLLLTSAYADETQLLVNIVNIEGREVKRFTQTVASGQQQTQLLLGTNLTQGIYFVRIQAGEKTETIRFVVQ